jgi:hypothetical protein
VNDYPTVNGEIEKRQLTLKDIQQWNPDAVFKIDNAYKLRMLGKKTKLQVETGKQKAENVIGNVFDRLRLRKRE